MSQRLFQHGSLEVLVGWDRPLQYYFLVVEDHSAPEDDPNEGYVFSNLRRRNPGMTLAEIKAELDKLGIVPPATLFDDLRKDQRKDDGETRMKYNG